MTPPLPIPPTLHRPRSLLKVKRHQNYKVTLYTKTVGVYSGGLCVFCVRLWFKSLRPDWARVSSDSGSKTGVQSLPSDPFGGVHLFTVGDRNVPYLTAVSRTDLTRLPGGEDVFDRRFF